MNGSYRFSGKGASPTELVSVHVREFLNLRRLPAMITSAQVAALLDCGGEHNIPVLIRTGFLKPLGHPPPNGVKYFATVAVLDLAADVIQLGRMRDALYAHWQGKNAARPKVDSSNTRR